MKSIYLTSIFFVLYSFSSLVAQTQTYVMNDCTISYPATWSLDTSGSESTRFVLFAPYIGDFAPNINFLASEINADLNLEDVKEATVIQIKQAFDKCKMIESKVISTTNPSYIKLVYTGTYKKMQLQWMQYIWLYNSSCYILTFTDLKKGFKKNQKDATFIFDSLRFN